jgi:hypothetical protein
MRLVVVGGSNDIADQFGGHGATVSVIGPGS